MNKAEADKLAYERNKIPSTDFCPLLRDFCRKDCVSFKPIRIHENLASTKNPEYFVRGGYCIASCLVARGDV